jgi:hypothetical protein
VAYGSCIWQDAVWTRCAEIGGEAFANFAHFQQERYGFATPTSSSRRLKRQPATSRCSMWVWEGGEILACDRRRRYRSSETRPTTGTGVMLLTRRCPAPALPTRRTGRLLADLNAAPGLASHESNPVAEDRLRTERIEGCRVRLKRPAYGRWA